MDRDALCRLTIGEAGPLLRDRRLSPVELARAFLDRIDVVDRALKSYVTVTADLALAQARAAEAEIAAGRYRGPLHGIPFALKDLLDTEGVRTTGQCRAMAHRVPSRNATAVQRLYDAGAVLLGKLALYELGLGGPEASLFERARNPWDEQRVTGGSSSGAGAALAADLCMAALATETVGSIRVPAALCGIVGLKPTYGRVSRHGVLPLSWSLDHCGPMARTTQDVAFVLEIIAGHDPDDATSSRAPVAKWTAGLGGRLDGVTLGTPARPFFEVGAETQALFVQALDRLRRLGARIEEVEIDIPPPAFFASPVIMLSEAFAFHRRGLAGHLHEYGTPARQRLLMGGLFAAGDYLHAQRVRRGVRREMTAALKRVDALATPTTGGPADRYVEGNSGGPVFSSLFSQVGLPAISVPCGFTADGLPVGLQITGRDLDEQTVLRVAHAYEQDARWFERRPALPWRRAEG